MFSGMETISEEAFNENQSILVTRNGDNVPGRGSLETNELYLRIDTWLDADA